MYRSKAWEIGTGGVALRGSPPHPQRAVVEHDVWTIRRSIEDVHDACCDASIWGRIGAGLPTLVPVLTNEAGGLVWRSPANATPAIDVRLRLERGRDDRETRLLATVTCEPADGRHVAQLLHEALRRLKQILETSDRVDPGP